jgi:type II secretory pathway pseudopilin PulG
MHRASRLNLHFSLAVPCSPDQGFSIIEGLLAAVIVMIAIAGTSSAFNLLTSSVRRTDEVNSANLAADNDISKIQRLSTEYTSCVVPEGSIPAANACTNTSVNEANYYFPQSTDPLEIQKFFTACQSSGSGSHITSNFVSAINSLPAVGSGVARQSAVREDSSDPSNHIVVVNYILPLGGSRILKIAPVVSSWCG